MSHVHRNGPGGGRAAAAGSPNLSHCQSPEVAAPTLSPTMSIDLLGLLGRVNCCWWRHRQLPGPGRAEGRGRGRHVIGPPPSPSLSQAALPVHSVKSGFLVGYEFMV
jgi:hypothetical protein